jgi:replicative DNA helicase
MLLESPELCSRMKGRITEEHFDVPEHRLVLRALMGSSSRNGSAASILDKLPDEGSRRLTAELALAAVTTDAVDEVFSQLEENRLQRQIQWKKATLAGLANDPGADQGAYDSLFEELMRLESQRRRFDDR